MIKDLPASFVIVLDVTLKWKQVILPAQTYELMLSTYAFQANFFCVITGI